jgi:hypothetical protein
VLDREGEAVVDGRHLDRGRGHHLPLLLLTCSHIVHSLVKSGVCGSISFYVDPYPTFHFDADPRPDPSKAYPRFYESWKI